VGLQGKILHSVAEGVKALEQLTNPAGLSFIEKAALSIVTCFQNGGKLLIAGNGGSLCDASHFAEELTGFFRGQRRALPAIVLNEPGHLTCVGNDIGFEYVFARALEAYGKQGDLFIGLTTSGQSPNMILAFQKAQELGLKTLAFLGKGGGKLRGVADLELVINGFATSDRIQEAHMVALHIMIELVEELLFHSSEEELLRFMISGVRS
jgi:D-sedoheptulose 7-phosphate isomerase